MIILVPKLRTQWVALAEHFATDRLTALGDLSQWITFERQPSGVIPP